MLYGKKFLILEEVTPTLLSNEIRKKPNQVEYEGSCLVVMERKGREGKKSEFVEGVSLLSEGMSLEKGLQASVRMVEEGRASCGGRHNIEQFKEN